MGRRGCASAMGMIKFPSSCSSPKALCNQFIDYYICSRGVFCINHIKLRNFVVITIECSIATVDRGSIMTRIYRWSMMVYSSLQAEFMVTKYDGQIHRYGYPWYKETFLDTSWCHSPIVENWISPCVISLLEIKIFLKSWTRAAVNAEKPSATLDQ